MKPRPAPRAAVGRPSRPAVAARRRRSYHHGDLRAALVEAAARMAAERGPAAVTLREVARRAGVSQAAPYHHFADKAALLAAVAEEGFSLFDTHQAGALAEAPVDPVQRLGALGVSYLRFALAYPHYFQVMFRPSLVACTRAPGFDTVAGRTFARLLAATSAARAARGHADADPYPAALAMWALPHGFASLYLEQAETQPMTPALLESLVRAGAAALAAAPLEQVAAQAF